MFGGLCHAEHIYDHADVVAIVGDIVSQSNPAPKLPILSTSTGEQYVPTSAVNLFRDVIHEIITQQIEWRNVIKAVIERARAWIGPTGHLEVMSVRPSLSVNELTETVAREIPDVRLSATDLAAWVTKTAHWTAKPTSSFQSKVAIVGMACRLPGGANDLEEFWNLLRDGREVYQKVLADRFDVDSYCDPSGTRVNTSHTPYGCFIN